MPELLILFVKGEASVQHWRTTRPDSLWSENFVRGMVCMALSLRLEVEGVTRWT